MLLWGSCHIGGQINTNDYEVYVGRGVMGWFAPLPKTALSRHNEILPGLRDLSCPSVLNALLNTFRAVTACPRITRVLARPVDHQAGTVRTAQCLTYQEIANARLVAH